MAGTNQGGVEAGRRNLFKEKTWVATPTAITNPKSLEVVHQLARSLGCKWITTKADLHDQAVGLISHLPVLISGALLHMIAQENDQEIFTLAKNLASTGFADTTRVGGGNPVLGVSMTKSNRSHILHALDKYHGSIQLIQEKIISEKWEELHELLIVNQRIRPDFLKVDKT